jgi:hypothetical protein
VVATEEHREHQCQQKRHSDGGSDPEETRRQGDTGTGRGGAGDPALVQGGGEPLDELSRRFDAGGAQAQGVNDGGLRGLFLLLSVWEEWSM